MRGESLGPYLILEPLGAGGMGEVYRARDTKLGREVAIKILPEALASEPEMMARFEREAKLLAALNHPRIGAIYNMETWNGVPFLVLELVEGESLDERLRRDPLTVSEALHIARQVAEALAAAHRAGVVHRDLKPANVMVVPDSLEVKVLDFGIAKALETGQPNDETQTALTRTGMIIGTAPYLSPEYLRGESTDHRADVWSYGCLLYEALTAARPFDGPTTAATVAAIVGAEPDWTLLPADTPDHIRVLLEGCLDKDPDRRVANMEEAHAKIVACEAAQAAGVAPPRKALMGAWAGGALAVAATIAVLLGTGLLRGPSGPGAAATDSGIDYIAVLPIENQSGDPGQDYVAAAMTEQLTTNLGSIPGLRVLGRQSARFFTTSGMSPTEFATRQELDGLVTGAVFQVGEDVRMTVHLEDGRSGDLVWTGSFVGTAGEIFALTDSTVRSIGREIGALTADPVQRLVLSDAPDPAALNAYGLGTFYMQDYTEDAMGRAIQAFRQAIDVDADFAPAHAALGRAYMLFVEQGFRTAEEYLPLARAEMDEAIRLDSLQVEVLTHAATLKLRTGRDWTGVREQYELALELNPSSGDAWHAYSHFLEAVLEPDQALEAARTYREVEPLTRGPWFHLANVHANRREWDNLIAVADSGLAIYPDYLPLRITRARGLRRQGETSSAIAELEGILAISRDRIAVEALALAYVDTGREAEARPLMRELEEAGALSRVATIRASLGEFETAFETLRRAIDGNQGALAFLLAHSNWDPLRQDPERWRQALEYAGFPAELIARSAAIGP